MGAKRPLPRESDALQQDEAAVTLALQEEKAPAVVQPPRAKAKAKARAKRPLPTTPQNSSSGPDSVDEAVTEQAAPAPAPAEKPRRGRRKLLHDEEQRKTRRKIQCKLNQRRYRARQRGLISTLSLETEGISAAIQELMAYHRFLAKYAGLNADSHKDGHQDGHTDGHTDGHKDSSHAATQSWSVWQDPRPLLVAKQFFKVFRHGFALHSTETSAIQENFLRFACDPGLVSQGAETDGVDALLLQLKRYTSYHAVFELMLEKLTVVHAPVRPPDPERVRAETKANAAPESALTWVLEGRGQMQLRLSRDTLMLVYPHIIRNEPLAQRVVGHTIQPSFCCVFHFDAQAKVGKFELQVDFPGAFLRLLQSAEDTAALLDGALISPFGELGMDPQGAKAESVLSRGNKQLSLKYILL
ncbi:hypothetical protein BBJ28_00020640 [Nothophytophthora sp. Chile5]|nr:hypothetical protein BBJ28_00020640 [Nothophytophthora sp. Chile5]